MIKRSVLRTLSYATALVAVATAAQAQEQSWPQSSVSYIIPFNAGGESDITARFQQNYFEGITGEPLVIKYQPGAGGAQAWSQLNNQPADGSVVMGTNLPHIIMQPKQGNAGYETDDLVTVYWFHYTPDAILVPQDSQFETLEDLVNFAKENPGLITFSGSGTNSANHIAKVRFDEMTGINTTYIPFSGTAPAVTAVVGGQVMAEWGYSTVASQQEEQLRMLAVATEERLPLFPDVPTFQELGYDLVSGAYRGVAVPRDTPEETRQQISSVIGEINANADFQEQMEGNGFVVTDIPYDEVESFQNELESELEDAASLLGIN